MATIPWVPALLVAPLLPLPLTTSTPPTPPDVTARWVTRRQSSRSRGATATRAVRAGASRGPAKPSLHLRTGVSECFTRTLCNASPGPYHFPCGCLLDDSRHPRPICYCSANGLVPFDTRTRQGRQKRRNTSCHLLVGSRVSSRLHTTATHTTPLCRRLVHTVLVSMVPACLNRGSFPMPPTFLHHSDRWQMTSTSTTILTHPYPILHDRQSPIAPPPHPPRIRNSTSSPTTHQSPPPHQPYHNTTHCNTANTTQPYTASLYICGDICCIILNTPLHLYIWYDAPPHTTTPLSYEYLPSTPLKHTIHAPHVPLPLPPAAAPTS